MNIKKLFFTCAVVALAHRVFSKPASGKPFRNRLSYDAIDDYIERQMHHLNIPGVSLAIVEDARITHLRGFGQVRQGGEIPSPQTPFFIGSLTKSFTALAVMQLVEAGKVELDAAIQKYLPWFRVADPRLSAQMTVRHLLNQTSGLPGWPGELALADFDDHPDATERQVRAISTLPVKRPSGSKCEYSNLNYNILGLIVEAASGEPYPDYVQNYIFNPLEMRHSYISKQAARQNGLAVGHRLWFWHPFPAPDLPSPRGSLPSGQLVSCAEDLAHYLIAYLNGGCYGNARILSEAGIEELQRGAVDYNPMGIAMGRYGMGWFVGELGREQTKYVWHTGSTPDFTSYMGLLPEQRKGVVMLSNAGHYMMLPTAGEVGAGAATLLAGDPTVSSWSGLDRLAPWMMRALLLVPLLQVVGVASTIGLLRNWRLDPQSCPNCGRLWGRHILLPLILNLLAALPVLPMLGKRRDHMLLFLPDLSWIAMFCGGFSMAWSFMRTGLILGAMQGPLSGQQIDRPCSRRGC